MLLVMSKLLTSSLEVDLLVQNVATHSRLFFILSSHFDVNDSKLIVSIYFRFDVNINRVCPFN